MNIKGYTLDQTCGACPEQYDVYVGYGDNRQQVAYLRLRHGTFTVRVPNSIGELIYTAYPKGDGCFMDDERKLYLNAAIEAIEIHNTGGNINI
jgi:hypothetical protein